MQKFIVQICEESEKILGNMQADCYVLNSALQEEFCRKFIEKAAIDEKIVLFYGENAVDKSIYFSADGIIVDLGCDEAKEKVVDLRKKLGKGKFIGLFCRARRHESMIVSEAEPDFVVFKIWKDGFENLRELTDWYNDFFLIQSAAWLMEDGIDYNVLKTDFIITPYS